MVIRLLTEPPYDITVDKYYAVHIEEYPPTCNIPWNSQIHKSDVHVKMVTVCIAAHIK